ncbi:hypothetical protein JDV02_002049 [Purpureocillium takamizusanense]|uniref:Oxidoreductase-like protein n=1 Tax=Purpureocillium takamizusanense TaxID=2060973 RepID=A0A9Q8QAB5_9HYPO|nr:uncharacterized protein JDV02_002049 [Purpureocillium takamizusanense]UNI15523.1 hypothetical protein JDV02_002049 [Purpureocillium takamizusanense]
MEAQSLASLNVLASNPPQYPEKPGEERRDPLVLYISRVPGTRDIILSPFKPQIKNVTAEDVASSLYYVHLELPGQEAQTDVVPRTSEDATSVQAIPRKPVSDAARPLTPDSLHNESDLQPPSQASAQLPARQRGSSLGAYGDSLLPGPRPAQNGMPPPPRLQTSMPARKPVGPRPMTEVTPPTPLTPDVDRSPVPPSGPALEQRPAAIDPPQDHTAAYESKRSPSPEKHSRRGSLAGSPFTLTLIRRDPSSGSQWNVGRVSSRQLELAEADVDQSGIQPFSFPPVAPPAASSPPISIEIETSGYAKFRRAPPRRSGEMTLEAVMAAAAEDHAPRNEIGVFSRQVVMGYSKSWTSNVKEKLRRMEQVGRARINRDRSDSTVSVDSAMSISPPNGDLQGMKPRGYTFTSPWDGKCEFRTGTTGRSVQCRHTLYDGEAAIYNPLVADQGSAAPKSGSKTVSELRFNLPMSEVAGEQARNAKDQWRGNFSKLLKPNGDPDADADTHDYGSDSAISPFEINVGSERAGGGNRGSRAKLGKLIVYEDGLKMLDLVVAANIGVWWGAWERTF